MSESADRVAAVVMETDDVDATAARKVVHLLMAMEELHSAGFSLVLIPTGMTVRLRRRRRWRRNPKEGTR